MHGKKLRMSAKDTKSVLKSNISTRDVINSINWSLFDACVLQNWQFFFLRSTIIVRHLTPDRSKYIHLKRCLSIVESMMINDHYFQLHSNANWRSVSAQLISNQSDWQCHVFFSFLALSRCFRFDFDFWCTVTIACFFLHRFFLLKALKIIASMRVGLKSERSALTRVCTQNWKYCCLSWSHAERKTPLICAALSQYLRWMGSTHVSREFIWIFQCAWIDGFSSFF